MLNRNAIAKSFKQGSLKFKNILNTINSTNSDILFSDLTLRFQLCKVSYLLHTSIAHISDIAHCVDEICAVWGLVTWQVPA